jgi:4-amino-4-deoxy-L-arabinose transferase-like glycosyltransferase
VIVLAGVPVFVNEGARQMADVPLAYYILATGVLIFLSSTRSKGRLLILAGLTAGLGAWTKNEGAVLVLGAVVAVVLATGRRGILRSLEYFGAGLAAPLAVLLYFRLRIAPAGDMLGGSASRLLAQGLDPARHVEILRHFGEVLFGFGSWGMGPVAVGIIPILLAYLALAKAPVGIPEVQAILALTGLLIVQLAGDYAAFLITPYDLAWHLSYSTDRLVLQFFPLFAFMILIMAKPVESLLRFRAGHGSGVQNAARR